METDTEYKEKMNEGFKKLEIMTEDYKQMSILYPLVAIMLMSYFEKEKEQENYFKIKFQLQSTVKTLKSAIERIESVLCQEKLK